MEALSTQLAPLNVSLDQIYLDPNNPRFVTMNWDQIPLENFDKSEIQEETRRRLIRDFSVDKLRMNMEVNGYLPIDRVIVQEFKTGKYVVLEGNRRICAAKLLASLTAEGGEVAEEVLQSVSSIPCLLYTGDDPKAAWVFQGLRHIVGITEWSAFNKAKLLVEQMQDEEMSLTDVGKRFGLSAHGAGQWVRSYHAFVQAKEQSDYLSEVDERSFPFFQELFGKSSIAMREWLDWDDRSYTFQNAINFNEFVGWLYPRPPGDEESVEEVRGDWEQRRLARRDDLRTLSYLLREEADLFQQFRSGAELEGVYALALVRKQQAKDKQKANPVMEVFEALENCSRALDNLPLKMIRESELKTQLLAHVDELEKRIAFVKSSS
jgi:hypothetical protein